MSLPQNLSTPEKRSGFALVISLSLMSFILVLLLSITAFVRVETSVAANSMLRMKSEQNALLALYQALGTLQQEMGPDQRISANADILDDSAALQNDNALAVENPHLVGVWDSSGDKTNTTVAEREGDLWSIGDGAINYASRSQQAFRRWLISTPDSSGSSLNSTQLNFAADASFRDENNPDTVRLLGKGTLRPDTPGALSSALQKKEVWAPIAQVDAAPGLLGDGGIAWAVLDEGVKARFNVGSREAPTTPSEALTYRDSPGTLGIEAMGLANEFASFPRGSKTPEKASDFEQGLMVFNGTLDRDQFGPYFHDLSFHSKSVLANVVDGGLKRDLSTLADERPAEYVDNNRRLYSDQTAGHTLNPAGDPHWSALLDYVNLYKDSSSFASGAYDLPTAQTTTSEWFGTASEPGDGDRAAVSEPLQAPSEFRLAPAISKVEIYVSLIGLIPHDDRNPFAKTNNAGVSPHSFYAHNASGIKLPNDQTAASIDLNQPRQLYLILVPVLTLHNPYNVPLDLNELWVLLRDPPIGIKFSMYDEVTGSPVPMTNDFVSISQMIVGNNARNKGDVEQLRFGMSLDGGVLLPGETKVFSPEFAGNSTVFDFNNTNANRQWDLDMVPGYVAGVGLIFDQMTTAKSKSGLRVTTSGYVDNGGGAVSQQINHRADLDGGGIAIKTGDRLQVAVAMVDGGRNPWDGGSAMPEDPNDPYLGTFAVELFSEDPNLGAQAADQTDQANLIGRYIFDANAGAVYNAGSSGVDERSELFAESASKNGEEYDSIEGLVAISDLSYQDVETAAASYAYTVKRGQARLDLLNPIRLAAFRVSAKVTKEETGIAYHPGMPYLQTNPSLLSGHYHIGEEASAVKSYDLSFQVPDGGSVMDPTITGTGRGKHHSGQFAGVEFATQYEIPMSPLHSIASLQHADIYGGAIPRVRYAIGNSFAHPVIPAGAATASAVAPMTYGFFDPSYLSNWRLWDRYYFSTIADQDSVLNGSAPAIDEVFKTWIAGGEAPNASLVAHLPNGKTEDDAETDLIQGNAVEDGAYLKMASYQMMEGGFNVNSTSVEAWKALLTTSNLSLNDQRIPTFEDTFKLNASTSSDPIQAVFSRFRIPNEEEAFSPSASPGDVDSMLWRGYRILNETDVDDLAEEIVEQVRHRGPFLSVADFVNRRIAAPIDANDNRPMMGVIDAAIQAAGLNDAVELEGGRNLTGDDVTFMTDDNYESDMIGNPEALAAGRSTASGIPAFLTQADVLQSIGPRLVARSDTFTIRAYGEVRGGTSNDVVSRSLCEAVFQRVPDYVDASQEPYFDNQTVTPAPDGLSATNESFGRRFKIVSFRWLEPNEI